MRLLKVFGELQRAPATRRSAFADALDEAVVEHLTAAGFSFDTFDDGEALVRHLIPGGDSKLAQSARALEDVCGYRFAFNPSWSAETLGAGVTVFDTKTVWLDLASISSLRPESVALHELHHVHFEQLRSKGLPELMAGTFVYSGAGRRGPMGGLYGKRFRVEELAAYLLEASSGANRLRKELGEAKTPAASEAAITRNVSALRRVEWVLRSIHQGSEDLEALVAAMDQHPRETTVTLADSRDSAAATLAAPFPGGHYELEVTKERALTLQETIAERGPEAGQALGHAWLSDHVRAQARLLELLSPSVRPAADLLLCAHRPEDGSARFVEIVDCIRRASTTLREERQRFAQPA